MRRRWQLILPVVGLLLFAGESYISLRNNREAQKTPSRYFWWVSIRLDSDPLSQRPQVAIPCKDAQGDCVSWDPVSLWVEPGLLAEALMLSALPAFVVGAFVVATLGRFGVSEVSSFMVTMPLLICAWYWVVGWLIDRWRFKRLRQT
jgi:hypothetical protein